MPFRISGTLARPKTDLLDKLVGARISQDLGGLINSFLRPIQGQKKEIIKTGPCGDSGTLRDDADYFR